MARPVPSVISLETAPDTCHSISQVTLLANLRRFMLRSQTRLLHDGAFNSPRVRLTIQLSGLEVSRPSIPRWSQSAAMTERPPVQPHHAGDYENSPSTQLLRI